MAVPSPQGDVKIVSPINTFLLNTLTPKKSAIFFSPLRAHLAWKRWCKWNAPIWPIAFEDTYVASNRNRGELYILQKEDKISSSRAHDPAQLLARSKEYMHNEKRRKPCLLSSARMLKTGSLSRGPPGVAKVTVLQWYGHPHFLGIPIPETLVIWTSPVTLTLSLTQTAKVIWEGNTHIPRVLGLGIPKTLGCPYHCNTGNFSGRNQIFKSKSKNPNPIQYSLFC